MPSGFSYAGELVALGTTLSWSIGIFPFTEAARRLGPNAVNHLRLLFAVTFLTILSMIFVNVSFVETGLLYDCLERTILFYNELLMKYFIICCGSDQINPGRQLLAVSHKCKKKTTVFHHFHL